jgi:hypothetical protein
MGTTHATLYRNPKTAYPWQMTGGAHVVSNTWRDEPKCFLMETDNNGAPKYCWMHTPKDGQNPNVSTYWETWFRLNSATKTMYFIICNQPTIQIASASIRGYALQVDGQNNRIDIERLDGGGVMVNLCTYAWPGDTDLHVARMSREVSGANRFWRLYYGNSTAALTLVAGPSASDATYTNFAYWGWDFIDVPREVFGGESCQS